MPNKQSHMGPPVARFNGLVVYARLNKPKTPKGRPRIWLVIRQEAPKKWRVAESLSYVNGIDIQFEEAVERCPDPTAHDVTAVRTPRR